MGKTDNPNEVEQKSFSDSLELFDSLFQEELEGGTNEQVPPSRAAAPQRPPSKNIPDKKSEKIPDVPDKEQSDELEVIPQAKKSTASSKIPVRGDKAGIPETKLPDPQEKIVSDKRTPSEGNLDTLKMQKKGAETPLESAQSDDEADQESGLGPIGMIRLGKGANEEPLPASASPEKVGKLYTPKQSKNLIPKISIKESNLYKFALTGFAVAIVAMVLINFFGLLGTKEPQKPSIPKNKSTAQKATLKKRSNVVAKKQNKSTASKKTPRKKLTVQKNSPKPASTAQRNQTVKNSSIKKPSSRITAAVPGSPPQPKTILPETTPTPRPSPQTNSIAERPSSQNLNPQESTPPQPNMSARAKRVQASSPPETQKTAEATRLASIEKMPSYPYSVYLGAYKTLERARVAVSQYQKKGVSSYWVKVDLGRKGVWHRLFTGYFQDGGTALDFISERNLEEASVKKTKYTTLIGVYTSEDAIIRKSQALDKLGYSSYIVDGGNGTAQLYSGAFLTKGGAEKHYHELAAKGVRNRVVER
jgi:hypothetical protein